MECSDDDRGDDVELTFDSVAGATYYTQWGGCVGAGCGVSSGSAKFAILTNDNRGFAAPAITRTRTNWSATTVAGEVLTCEAVQYGRTVWFRYVAPAAGTVTLTASGFDLVTALYRESATSPFVCNDNDQGNILQSAVSGYVQPGEVLYLQVGGKNPGTGGFENFFSLAVAFGEDLDIDNDGYNRTPGPDCVDTDPTVFPQQVEVPNNGKDDDCAAGDSHDTDGDGQDARPFGPDCNDGNDTIFRGAAEIRGNYIDENCDDRTPAARLSPFPDISYGHVAVLRGRQFGKLKVTSLGKGYRIAVRCRSSSRCPGKFKKTTRTGRPISTNRYKGVFPPGTVVEVRVTKPRANRFGFYTEYKVVAPRDLIKRTCTIQPKSGKLTGCHRA